MGRVGDGAGISGGFSLAKTFCLRLTYYTLRGHNDTFLPRWNLYPFNPRTLEQQRRLLARISHRGEKCGLGKRWRAIFCEGR
jgi:hypothetical protein